ncbi:MAG: hypothetical protein AB8B65_05300 [Kordia sp.]|uniref:hypothetical protein n=1 Tax=Kordia sp. TaxID=1965332 RepID=UPI00385940FA
MEISGHCSFCEHKKFDFKVGNLCGLTQKKADFLRKCPRIMIGDTAKEEIAKINFEYKELQDEKLKVVSHLVLYTILGIVLFLVVAYLTQRLFNIDWVIASTRFTGEVAGMTIIGIAGGIATIMYAFKPYIKYTNANHAVKSQKKRMDAFFALYDYEYRINFEDENYQTAVTLYRSKQKIRS